MDLNPYTNDFPLTFVINVTKTTTVIELTGIKMSFCGAAMHLLPENANSRD
jgi:hypothetical protein